MEMHFRIGSLDPRNLSTDLFSVQKVFREIFYRRRRRRRRRHRDATSAD